MRTPAESDPVPSRPLGERVQRPQQSLPEWQPLAHAPCIEVNRQGQLRTNLALRHEDGDTLYIHGSPRDPTNEYVLATEIGFGPTEKFEEIFASFKKLLFVGHTHLPCVITDEYESKTSAELDNKWVYPGKGKAIIKAKKLVVLSRMIVY